MMSASPPSTEQFVPCKNLKSGLALRGGQRAPGGRNTSNRWNPPMAQRFPGFSPRPSSRSYKHDLCQRLCNLLSIGDHYLVNIPFF